MITKVKKYMEKHHMADPGDEIVVGLSGGADSVCLLFLLKKLSEQMGFTLGAVHINHELRKEADAEEAFVKELCQKWDIFCESVHVDVKSYAKENHLCVEEAARSLRYQVFEKLAAREEDGKVKIALAHHQNDQAETVLFHLFRGSGIRGLMGIRPVRDFYIRPLLCLERAEIEQFVRENQLDFVTDASNFDTTFSRNKIRHDLLPMAEREICRGSVSHIAGSAELVRDAVDFLDEITEQTYVRLVREQKEGCCVNKDDLERLHPYLKSSVIYEMLSRTCKKKRDISKVHVDSVRRLLEGQSGRKINLIYGLQAVVQQQELVIRKEPEDREKGHIEEKPLDLKGEIEIVTEETGAFIIRCRIFSYEKEQPIPNKPYTKWFDYDKINSCPILRNRREGDYLYCSSTARKKIKDYFINEKIPLLERERLFMIADGDHIMWIPGYRISSFYKITDETRQVLEITISGGKEYEP